MHPSILRATISAIFQLTPYGFSSIFGTINHVIPWTPKPGNARERERSFPAGEATTVDHLDLLAGRVRAPIVALAALFALAGPGAAQEPAAAPAAQDTARLHVVRPGDTLWDLAAHYYGDPWQWPRIHEANTGVVANPHLILPSWELIIPGIMDAAPAAGLLGVETGIRPVPAPAPMAEPLAEPLEAEPAPLPPPERTVFYPRDARSVLLAEAAARPLVSPGEFYSASWLTEGAAIPVLGTVVDRFSRESGDVLAEMAHPHSQLYLSYGPGPRPEIGQRLLGVRRLREVPGHGVILEPRAIVQVVSLDPEVMTVIVVRQFGEFAVGDIVIPASLAPDLTGRRVRQVVSGPEGSILTFLVPQPVYSTHDHAFINLGRAHGLGVGDELIVILPDRPVAQLDETRLPSEVVARLRVLRVGERTSTAKVIQLTEPVLEQGLPVRVVGQVQ